MSLTVSRGSGPSGIGNGYFDEGKYDKAVTSYTEQIVSRWVFP